MRVAWFRPTALTAFDARQRDALQAELTRRCVVEAFDEQSAHQFVWQHARDPFDVCLYEWGAGARYGYLYAYLVHYPGVVVLHGRIPDRLILSAARMIIVGDQPTADLLAIESPATRIAVAPPFAAAVDTTRAPRPTPDPVDATAIRFAPVDVARVAVTARAMQRARDAGANAVLLPPPPPTDDVTDVLGACDVLIALEWPAISRAQTAALLGMSAGKPVVVFEAEATATWAALDPQTWQPRGFDGDVSPIVVSIDPRDEEHSLMLAIRRLSGDAGLRARLGAAGHAWWTAHATPRHAADAWQRILDTVVALPPIAADAMLDAKRPDGSERARALLAPFGIEMPF